MSIKVFLADDHAIIRDGLRALLEAKPGISVVGDASDGKQVLSQVNELQPDVVVMDILMPEINGIEATQKILETSPQVRVIILSMLGTADHVFRALRAGVRGFLLKESAGREVVDAVEAVYSGDMYFSGPITNTLVNDYMQMREESETDTIEKLSLRENEILCLVVEGKTSAEIGRDLHLSPKTVESYRSRIMQKLGISDLPELIKYAIKHGLISLD
jgi:DNA-binding NarL/FixJ family response regulator